jgi:hypothetical protein
VTVALKVTVTSPFPSRRYDARHLEGSSFLRIVLLMVLVSLVSGCIAASPPFFPANDKFQLATVVRAAVSVTQIPFQRSAPCTGAFVAHDLEHITQTAPARAAPLRQQR